ncbi:hypothetical protein N480_07480 [Pseudoalteromonas luteoviolacea S2607]|uniref:O-antigen translocase n=1 Tax=Pseudoalteromonas luteoviolacea TaxID=43657 RepID=UPI0007B08D84|nr:O-antigen translocase [Pseudoalteromonas luteoviolacea]KZN29557.1 hypothetical protein N480_07480 [Pseudoalteromonas luteoviolacea S2607]
MTLLKTSFLNGIAVVVKMITLLIINKVLATFVGPAGYATIGQFHNAVQMVTAIASGAIQNSVTKYTAEYVDDFEAQKQLWKTAGMLSVICALVCAVILILLKDVLAVALLKDESLSSVFVWFAITLVFFVFNALLLAIINGKKEIPSYVAANICGSIISLVITIALSMSLGLYGALLSLAIYQSVSFFATLFIILRLDWFKISFLIGRLDPKIAKNISMFSLMAITTAICSPITQMLVREHIGTTIGWVEAGYWEALMRLSAAYLMFVTTTLAVYFLPKFSELDNYADIKKELFNGYKLILPAVAIMGVGIYLFRDFIVHLLFTEEFSPITELLAIQLIGDTLKIGSWVVAYLMIGKAMFRLFIGTEMFFSASFYGFIVYFTNQLGIEGAVLGYTVNYFFYWLVILVLVMLNLKNNLFLSAKA